MKKIVVSLALVIALCGIAAAQSVPTFQSSNCANSPQMGRATLCWDTVVNQWFYWNPTTMAFTETSGASGTVHTGTGLTGNGSSGTPVAISPPVSVANGGTGTTSSGAVAYSNVSGGFAANVNLTGTDSVSLSGGNQKLTLTANETLTINEGTISNTPSATNLYRTQFEICQNGTGGYTIALSAGTGVSNIYLSGGASSLGNTLTASYGDWLTCNYDGTNLRCGFSQVNEPC
jgi:hypothetical protein